MDSIYDCLTGECRSCPNWNDARAVCVLQEIQDREEDLDDEE